MNLPACDLPDLSGSGAIPQVVQLVDTVAKKLKQLQRGAMRDAELTPAQYSVLSLLWERDGRPFHELASGCCCSPSTITGVVDTLERKALVKRQANPGDRRSMLVKLTAEGKALEGMTPALDEVFESCCRDISSEELRQLTALLAKLNDTLSS